MKKIFPHSPTIFFTLALLISLLTPSRAQAIPRSHGGGGGGGGISITSGATRGGCREFPVPCAENVDAASTLYGTYEQTCNATFLACTYSDHDYLVGGNGIIKSLSENTVEINDNANTGPMQQIATRNDNNTQYMQVVDKMLSYEPLTENDMNTFYDVLTENLTLAAEVLSEAERTGDKFGSVLYTMDELVDLSRTNPEALNRLDQIEDMIATEKFTSNDLLNFVEELETQRAAVISEMTEAHNRGLQINYDQYVSQIDRVFSDGLKSSGMDMNLDAARSYLDIMTTRVTQQEIDDFYAGTGTGLNANPAGPSSPGSGWSGRTESQQWAHDVVASWNASQSNSDPSGSSGGGGGDGGSSGSRGSGGGGSVTGDYNGDGRNDGSAGPSGCFLAGTQITMADGSLKNIEDVRIGESVRTYDEATRQMIPNQVSQTSITISDHHFVLEFSDQTIIKTTDQHPFLTKSGWKSLNPTATLNLNGQKVDQLTIDDEVFRQDGKWIKLESAHKIMGDITVYNLKDVQNTHTFFVNGFCVHNK